MNRVMHHRGSPNDNEYRVALNKLRLMKLDFINDVLSRPGNIMEKLNSLFGLFTLIEERVRRYSNNRSY